MKLSTKSPAEARYIIHAQGAEPELLIYDEIGSDGFGGGVSAKDIAEQLQRINASTICVRINSRGGSVFDAIAIHSALTRHPAHIICEIDGCCLSAASAVAMGCDEIKMAASGLMMLHDPSGFCAGSQSDMDKTAEALAMAKESLITIYATRTGLSRDRIGQMMSAETWFTAEEAVAQGFADSVFQGVRIAASATAGDFWARRLDQLTAQCGGDRFAARRKLEQLHPGCTAAYRRAVNAAANKARAQRGQPLYNEGL